jgi:dihydrofolate synthase
MTIISHAFKRTRLVDAHCGAIGFPLHRVSFVGISPPGLGAFGSSAQDLEKAAARGQVAVEKAAKMKDVHAVVDLWAKDPHGVGEVLAGKRRKRNCWNVEQLLFFSDEERLRSGVKTVRSHDGAEALLDGTNRPWAVPYP